MSLVAIVKPNIKIELPNDATWLCACMHRNCLESSRCENCGTDFLKIYKGFNFKELGGKMNFFTNLNQSPEEEINIVVNKNSYPYDYTNISLNEKNKTSLGHQSINGIKNKRICDATNKKKKEFVKYNSILNKIKFKGNIKKLIGSINIWLFIILLICDLTFNLFLDTSLKKLNIKISKVENMVNIGIHFPNGYNNNYYYYYFDNGDIYCGQLNNGLPNGIGIVYSSDVLIIGSFHNGLKNGEFKFLYVDGTFETRIYNMDKLVSKDTTFIRLKAFLQSEASKFGA